MAMYYRKNERLYSDDITDAICKLLSASGVEVNEEEKEDISHGVYWLRCAADNNCNHDYFRSFYNALSDIAHNV